MKNTLNNLTLIVPTYFRQSYALRLMRYWNDKGPKVIVLDGTDCPIPQKDLVGLGSSVVYMHNPVSMHERIRSSLNLIETDYVALNGDDEFYIPSAVIKCIQELQRNQELVACCGRALAFYPRLGSIYSNLQYPMLKNYSLDSGVPENRLTYHMTKYVPSLIYAISKKDPWKKAWIYTSHEEFPAYAIGELQFEMCMSVAGKSRVLSELMWLRSRGEVGPLPCADASLEPKNSFPEWWRNPSTKKDRDRFLYLMSDAFADLLGKSGDRRDWVVRAFDAYLLRYLEVEQRGNVSFRKHVKNIIKKILPPPYMEAISRVRRSLRSGFRSERAQPTLSLLAAAESLHGDGVSVDFVELRNIEETIISFHRDATCPMKQ